MTYHAGAGPYTTPHLGETPGTTELRRRLAAVEAERDRLDNELSHSHMAMGAAALAQGGTLRITPKALTSIDEWSVTRDADGGFTVTARAATPRRPGRGQQG